MIHQKWRLGIDLGSNSLGWCALALDDENRPICIIAAGSRIFSNGRDPQSHVSLAVDRRVARAMRRRRDRLKQRRQALIEHLTKDGLFPADPDQRKALESHDPFALRALALEEPLPPFHLGRVFFQLNQRRGFKSNRKTDRANDKEAGAIKVGLDRLRHEIIQSGSRTFGEFLHKRRAAATDANNVPSVRARLRPETGEGAKGDGYDFYPGRDLIEDEFNAIWDVQWPYQQERLTPDVRKRLHEIVFYQRPLKAPKIGMCTLVPGEQRLAKAHPLFQRRRLLEEVNQLEIVRPGEAKQKLTREQRDMLILALRQKQEISFETLRNKTLKLDPAARFNKESETRKKLAGDEINAQFADKKRFGARWSSFSLNEQWAIIQRIRDEEDSEELNAWLRSTYALSDEAANAIASAHLPEGYGRFGQSATEGLIAALEANVIPYSEAVIRAGFAHHSDFRTGEIFLDKNGNPALPYYGVALERSIMPGTGDPSDPEEMRVGRITNPTVHIGLNQLRRTVNALIRAYGRPEEIALELARELKMNEEEKKKANAENAANRRAAEQRSEKLREISQPDTGANRALLKLWEDLNPDNILDRRCVYTGTQIGIDMLFNGLTEVDHILPLSETLDDSNGNKILCMREANRFKRKRSPFEAFGASADWTDIAARAARLPKAKRWRFEPDAMARFQENDGFLARQLIDTQHLSKLAREYLATLYPEKGIDSSHVWVSPGRLTELVRRKLGLNDLLCDHNIGAGADQSKNRLDHRHHAIDAAVIGIVDRSLLQAMARASGKDGREGPERIIVPVPWEGFRDDLRAVVNRIIVSHRADHGTASKANLRKGQDQTAGRLHNATAYGLTGETDAKGNDIVVRRVPLTGVKPDDLSTDATKGVRDPYLRAALRSFTQGTKDKDFIAALRRFAELGPLPFRGIRRLRVVKPLSVIRIKDRQGRAYKGYKGDSNYRYDVWEMPDGKWRAEVISMFDAHQPGWTSEIRAGCPTARKVLSLRQHDLIAIEPDGARRIMMVVKFGQSGSITLAPPNEAGTLKARHELPNDQDPFKYTNSSASSLKQLSARQIRIDELGRVQDPGFPARKHRRKTRAKPEAKPGAGA